MKEFVTACLLFSVAATTQVVADDSARAHYLGNAGVMVERGATKILFDPLYRNDYGQYELVPADIERSMFAGDPPWDGIDAVFISHYHGDHFTPAVMLDYLEAHESVVLYAPAQAVAALQSEIGSEDPVLLTRIRSVDVEYREAPLRLTHGDLDIEALAVPHSGWPERMTDIENLAFRVTLDDETTVLHLGDADTSAVHFTNYAALWSSRDTDLALPPYWFFLSPHGRSALQDIIRPAHAIGVHVPERMPDDVAARPADFEGFDLFTRPGETRDIP